MCLLYLVCGLPEAQAVRNLPAMHAGDLGVPGLHLGCLNPCFPPDILIAHKEVLNTWTELDSWTAQQVPTSSVFHVTTGTSQSQSPDSSHLAPPPWVRMSVLGSAFYSCPANRFYPCHFSRFHMYVLLHNVFSSFWLASLCVTTLGSFKSLQMTQFHSLRGRRAEARWREACLH